jgi:hypothetical protein
MTDGAMVMVLLPVVSKSIVPQKGFRRGESMVAWYVEALGPKKIRATYFTDYSVVDPKTNQKYKELTPKVLAEYMKVAMKGKVREKKMFEAAAVQAGKD